MLSRNHRPYASGHERSPDVATFLASRSVRGDVLRAALMCGIAALVSPARVLDDGHRIEAMTASLEHRGPDDSGTVVLADEGVALGMRRLSILDLAGGKQPMWNESRSQVLVFNGEIYNFEDLRRELAGHGHQFASDHSDTEVLVHGFEQWGTGLFGRLNGMFAVAVWDRSSRRLVIARDRVGEKPLYVARLPAGYAIASEMKALLCHPGVERRLDPGGLEEFLAFDYAVAPKTILADVTKLPAGHYAIVDEGGYQETPYWIPDLRPRHVDEHAVLERLDSLLDRSVALRMVADVPLGLFLSGGLDSTTVGWYMTRHSSRVESFSIGFEDAAFDETDQALLAARHLGTDHRVETLSSAAVLDIVPQLADILDEPMGDQSILPTYLLSRFARRRVTVALGGDGGDELFMGYNAFQGFRLSAMTARLPWLLPRVAGGLARRLPRRVGNLRLRGLGWVAGFDDPVFARAATGYEQLRAYRAPRRFLAPALRAELGQPAWERAEARIEQGVDGLSDVEARAIVAYLRGYLADDVLVKVDRASMAASLEVRAPFLDAELVDYMLAVPPSLKLRRMRRKHLLRALMRDRLPSEIVERSKFGFNAPVGAWLRGPLAPLVRDALSRDRVEHGGYLDPTAVAGVVERHLAGQSDEGHVLWKLLQLELWRERWLRPPSAVPPPPSRGTAQPVASPPAPA